MPPSPGRLAPRTADSTDEDCTEPKASRQRRKKSFDWRKADDVLNQGKLTREEAVAHVKRADGWAVQTSRKSKASVGKKTGETVVGTWGKKGSGLRQLRHDVTSHYTVYECDTEPRTRKGSGKRMRSPPFPPAVEAKLKELYDEGKTRPQSLYVAYVDARNEEMKKLQDGMREEEPEEPTLEEISLQRVKNFLQRRHGSRKKKIEDGIGSITRMLSNLLETSGPDTLDWGDKKNRHTPCLLAYHLNVKGEDHLKHMIVRPRAVDEEGVRGAGGTKTMNLTGTVCARVAVTTPFLAACANPAGGLCIQADSTHKTNSLNLPTQLVGSCTANREFMPHVIQISTDDTESAYTFLFTCLRTALRKANPDFNNIAGCDYLFRICLTDHAEAIYNGMMAALHEEKADAEAEQVIKM